MTDEIIGKTFGRWTVLEKIPKYNNMYGYYLCKCECGTIKPVKKGHLLSGESLSCGCYTVDIRRLKAREHIGEVHGGLTIIDVDMEEKSKYFYICRCECGKVVRQMYTMLSSGRATSCGCSRLKPDKERDERLLALTNASRAKYNFKGTNIANIRSGHVSTKTKSGVKGVYQRANGKWIARIGFKNKLIHLGTFDDEEEAKDARIEAEKKYYAPVIEEFNEIYSVEDSEN